jgi:hypothetical protein
VVAIPTQGIGLLLAEYAREPFVGPVMTYGMQTMNLAIDGALWMFETLGIEPDERGMDDPPVPPTPIDFARLVRLLGLGALSVLDVSAYEKADVVADLNDPAPPDLRGRFGLIVDGGTMEHVFDIRQGMMNTADMLRPGGRVVHFSPVNNYVNHGFVQLSPTFYHDYYTANGFEDVRGVILVQARDHALSQPWNLFNYDHETMGGVNSMFCGEETQLAIYFTARKTAASTSNRVPLQTYFARMEEGKGTVPHKFGISHHVTNPRVELIDVPEDDGIAQVSAVVHFGPR